MASRLNNSQVCILAKTALQQAKESINPAILRPVSREVPVQEHRGNIKGDGQERDKYNTRASSCLIHRKIPVANATERQIKGNALSYSSSCHPCRYSEGNRDNGKVLLHQSIPSEDQKALLTPSDISKFSVDRVDANLSRVHNSISISEGSTGTRVNEIDTPSLLSGKNCWPPCYSDILKENLRRKLEDHELPAYTEGSSDRSMDELVSSSNRSFEPKLLGPTYNISSLMGSQYLRGHFVNLRSLTDVVRPNGNPCKNPIRKNTKQKKSSSKLFKNCSKTDLSTPSLKHIPSRQLRRRSSHKEPANKCTSEEKMELCKTADDWKSEAKPLKIIPCTPKTIEMKPNTPLKRLKKFVIPEPVKSCECFEKCCTGADESLMVEKKKLPELPKCDKIETSNPKFSEMIPLKPPVKVNDPKEPPRVCPKKEKCDYICKTDDNIVMEKKSLPKIPAPLKPPSVIQEKPCTPMKRLKKREIPEPKRSCKTVEQCCFPRCDATLREFMKKLPKIPAGKVNQDVKILEEIPLRRLKKVVISEPPKICPIKVCEKIERPTYSIPRKTLPPLKPSCPCPLEPLLLKDVPLKRLPAVEVEEPARVCPPPLPKYCLRVDKDLSVKKKRLPELRCDKIKQNKPEFCIGTPLKRPVRINDPQEPPKVCPVEKKDSCRTVRNIPVPKKSLPKIPALDMSPKVNCFKEGMTLKRLKKVVVPELPKYCPPVLCEDKTDRADAKLHLKKCSLPKIQVGLSCSPKFHPTDNPPIRRLPKIDMREPERICPTVNIEKCERVIPRPDKKRLPKLECGKLNEVKVSCTKKESTEDINSKKCSRSGSSNWSLPLDNISNCVQQKDPNCIKNKRSMSTNLTDHYTKGLLLRKMQMSHIDVRKRLSFISIGEKYSDISKYQAKNDSFLRKFSDEPKDLQPKNPMYRKFDALEPIRPEAQELNPQEEDECIRRKLDIPKEPHTITCENPNPKKKYLRAADKKVELGSANLQNCDGVVNRCSDSSKESRGPSNCPPDRSSQPPPLSQDYQNFRSCECPPPRPSECPPTRSNAPLPHRSCECPPSRSNAPPPTGYRGCPPPLNQAPPPPRSCECPPPLPNAPPPPSYRGCPPPLNREPPPPRSCECPPSRSKAPPRPRSCECPPSRSNAPPPPTSRGYAPPPYQAPPPLRSCECPPPHSNAPQPIRSCECPPPPSSYDPVPIRSCEPPPNRPYDPAPIRSCEPPSSRSYENRSFRSCECPPSCSYETCDPPPQAQKVCRPVPCTSTLKSTPRSSLWQRVKNYFKARPNCPTPAEAKRKKKLKKLQKIADKAGMGVYDPYDDSTKICKEVERRCCAVKKLKYSNKRRYHCYGSVQYSSRGLYLISNRSILENQFISLYQHIWFRTIKNWRNPYEFYEMEDAEETLQETKTEIVPYSGGNIINSSKAIRTIDLDSMAEIMCRCLKLHPNELDEGFKMHVHYLLEFSPECLEKKRDVLIEVLNAIYRDMSLRKNENLDESDSKKQPDLLRKLANIRNRR